MNTNKGHLIFKWGNNWTKPDSGLGRGMKYRRTMIATSLTIFIQHKKPSEQSALWESPGFQATQKLRGEVSEKDWARESRQRKKNVTFAIQPVFSALQADRRASSRCLGLGSAVKDSCASVCAWGRGCAGVRARVHAGVRRVQEVVWRCVCYFLQGCLPATGVSAIFFFLKGDIKTRHWVNAVFVILKFDPTWYLHESQLQSIDQFCKLTIRKRNVVFILVLCICM